MVPEIRKVLTGDKEVRARGISYSLYPLLKSSDRCRLNPLLDEVDADPGRGWDGYGAVRAQNDLWIDQIRSVVPAACGDIAGKSEVGQRREVDVVRAADAALEHSAVPHRNVTTQSEIVQRDRLPVSAHPPGLDVDDAAGVERDGVFRISQRVNRLIQANRRVHLRLKFRMITNVVVVQWLFDHQEMKSVERAKMVHV
jgi:hypothetical protein